MKLTDRLLSLSRRTFIRSTLPLTTTDPLVGEITISPAVCDVRVATQRLKPYDGHATHVLSSPKRPFGSMALARNAKAAADYIRVYSAESVVEMITGRSPYSPLPPPPPPPTPRSRREI